MTAINRDILALSIPSIITNVTTPLLGLVDVAVTGHMGSAVYLAAIAVGGTAFNLIYWLMSFLRMSASGLTAQAYGRSDLRSQTLILARELVIAISAGAAVIALSPLAGPWLIRFVDPSPASSALALRYFEIVVWGAPAVLATYALSGWFLGRQNSRVPMWSSFLINVSNIVVSLILVFGLGWRIEGVATGTLVAQWLGVASLALACVRCRLERVALRDLFRLSELRRLFNVSAAIFLRTVCMVAVTFWFTRVGAEQGNVMLAVNALLMQFFMLFSYIMDGFAFAGEAMVGRYVGARSMIRLRLTVVALMKFGGALALIFTAAYICGGEWFLSILSGDMDVVDKAGEYAVWSFLIPLAGFAAFAWDGIYVGATFNRMMMLSMGVATAVFFGLFAVAYPKAANHGLWLAFIAYLAARSLTQSMMWPRMRRYLMLRTGLQSVKKSG